MNTIIETHKLSRHFRKCEAVHELDLRVPTGSVFAFLGRNGAGKTTAIKLLAGLLRPTSGSATLLGRDAQQLRPAEWRQIGYVSENQRLYDWLTVEELIVFTARLYPNWDAQFSNDLLRHLGIPANRQLRHCSRGEKMKTALLLALAHRPRLVILDEPFGGLDALVREEFLASLLEITKQSEWTIFFSSHDIDEVERLADSVGIIESGRLAISESLEQLQRRCQRVEIFSDAPEKLMNKAFVDDGLIAVERGENQIRFIHTQFSETANRELAQQFPGAHIEVWPMSLREIFVSFAKTYQNATTR